jgi:hypothetical protein
LLSKRYALTWLMSFRTGITTNLPFFQRFHRCSAGGEVRFGTPLSLAHGYGTRSGRRRLL